MNRREAQESGPSRERDTDESDYLASLCGFPEEDYERESPPTYILTG